MSPTRRVFIFSREYPPLTVGGTSTVARSLAKGLAAEGWQVLVVTSHTGTDDVHELVDDVSVLRTGTGVLYNGETGLRDQSLRTHRRILAAANWLVSVLGPPDLVALPDLFCYPEAMLLAREHSVPLINVLLQDFEAITPYDRDGHRVTTGTTADRADLLAIEAKALRTSDHTVFISHALRDAITGRYGVDSATQSVVHLGVDPAEIAAVEADSGRFERLTALRGASAPRHRSWWPAAAGTREGLRRAADGTGPPGTRPPAGLRPRTRTARGGRRRSRGGTSAATGNRPRSDRADRLPRRHQARGGPWMDVGG